MNNWYQTIALFMLFAITIILVGYIDTNQIKPRLMPELTKVQYERYCEIMSKNVMEAYKRGRDSK